MDSAQKVLFGEFPRAIGVTTPDYDSMELRQYLVHSEMEFDGVLEMTSGKRNLYSSISAYEPVKTDDSFAGNAIRADRVSFDFDSSAKLSEEEKEQYDEDEDTPNWSHPLIPEFASDYAVIKQMHKDSDIREAVLGDVCFNVQKLSEYCLENDLPFMGVFSGFGIHIHQFRELTRSRPGDKMLSTANKIVAELSLACVDERASGRPFRIMRIPNTERVCHYEEKGTGLYQIPLKPRELRDIEPEELMSMSRKPRPSIGSEPNSRPSMKVHEDYLGSDYEDGVGQEKMRPLPQQTNASDFAKTIIKEVVQMPCVYERAFGRNPPNDLRVKLGIMLLNADYSAEEATNLISQLGWVDFDYGITKYQLEQLEESGKGDWSCKTMMAKGLCVRADDKKSCPTYGYRGGNTP